MLKDYKMPTSLESVGTLGAGPLQPFRGASTGTERTSVEVEEEHVRPVLNVYICSCQHVLVEGTKSCHM